MALLLVLVRWGSSWEEEAPAGGCPAAQPWDEVDSWWSPLPSHSAVLRVVWGAKQGGAPVPGVRKPTCRGHQGPSHRAHHPCLARGG